MDKINLRKLKILVESEHWDAIHIFVDKVVEKWNNEPVKADDQFNTVYNLAHRDGKIEGVKEFLNSAEQLSHEN